ncbi:MAG: hypothetical protein CM1200mP22_30810 [Dehalococcoidia bacterium]|nr:MAG: hypothetical protein CM1200mP22_30810 [Dehalococcoidia bacterium]
MAEIAGSEFEIETELTLLAMGFLHPEGEGMLSQIGVELDGRGNIAIDSNRMSSVSESLRREMLLEVSHW